MAEKRIKRIVFPEDTKIAFGKSGLIFPDKKKRKHTTICINNKKFDVHETTEKTGNHRPIFELSLSKANKYIKEAIKEFSRIIPKSRININDGRLRNYKVLFLERAIKKAKELGLISVKGRDLIISKDIEKINLKKEGFMIKLSQIEKYNPEECRTKMVFNNKKMIGVLFKDTKGYFLLKDLNKLCSKIFRGVL